MNRGSRVSDISLEQILSGIPNGKYRLTVSAGNIQQSASGSHTNNSRTPQTGAWIFAGYKTAAIDTIKVRSFDFIVVDNTVNIGLKTEKATGNWVTADNFQLEYIGRYDVSDYADYLSDYIAGAQKILSSKMQAAVKEALEDAIEQARQAISAVPLSEEDLAMAKSAIEHTFSAAQASAKAYVDIQTAVDYAIQVLDWYAGESGKRFPI